VDCEGLGDKLVGLCCFGRTDSAAAASCAEGDAKRTHEARRKSCARSVIAENYSGVGSFGDTKAINGPPRRKADWATTLNSARGASDKPSATRPFGGW
jgi:hypothetical protein